MNSLTSLLSIGKFHRFLGKVKYHKYQKNRLLRKAGKSFRKPAFKIYRYMILRLCLDLIFKNKKFTSKFYLLRRRFGKYLRNAWNWYNNINLAPLKYIFSIFSKYIFIRNKNKVYKKIQDFSNERMEYYFLKWKWNFFKNEFLMSYVFKRRGYWLKISKHKKKRFLWLRGMWLDWRKNFKYSSKKEKRKNIYNIFILAKDKMIDKSFLQRSNNKSIKTYSYNNNYTIHANSYNSTGFKQYLAQIFSYKEDLFVFNNKYGIDVLNFNKKIKKIKLLNYKKKLGNINIKLNNELLNLLYDLIEIKFNQILPLWYLNYKFQTKTLLNLHYILSKIYQNDVEIKLINLNYIFLDSHILTKAIAKRMRIMRINSKKYKHMAPRRVFFMGYSYAAKAGSYISITYINKYKRKIFNKNPFFIKYRWNKNQTFLKTGFVIKNILYNNKHINKYILYILHQKKICGIHMVGSGRLTRRYTAARAVMWKRLRGNLRNIPSSNLDIKSKWMRGNAIPNVQRSTIAKSNRIGSYGIRTWISSH
jgi:hypothetical protein